MRTEVLRANGEHNERRDAKNAKLKARIKELESEFRDRITKVEQKQTLNDNSSNLSSSNFNLVADQVPMVTHHEKSSVDTSLPEDKEMDAFLDEVHKKKVSNEIRQRNREKKLLRESSTKDLSVSKGPASSVTQDKEPRSHKKKEAENIVQDVFDFTMDGSEKKHVTEISLTGREENNCHEKIESRGVLEELSSSDVLQNINRLYENACTAENERKSANSIAELSDSQIQTIVDYFSNNPNTELPDDQEGSIIDSEEEISCDQTDASEAVSATRAEIIPLESVQPGLPVSILPENPEEKRKHIIGLVLEKFPYLSLDDSDERRDTFNLDGSTLCPLCNEDHKVNRSIFDEIKGEWGDGEYYGERTYRLKCRESFKPGIPIVSVKA
ncbi:hypothetical protein GLOIN_2v1598257 [Rhizophagus clarus]|uniref:Uncharacterized protein n=1 Tax=Rhizophagus clarus TaxID=94130 RepID=A0A8H3MCH0_9GLOM|nr:hypothetical protein GLOIN_2v1598257 [Rhizophagus clarus]